MSKEQLMEAFKLSCPIRYYDEARNKEGIYQILAIGKSQDDSGTWHESVTYTDGEETYTRYVENFSDKFSMLINDEENELENFKKNFSVNILIRNKEGFKPLQNILMNSMKNYHDKRLPFSVTAASHFDELTLLDKAIEFANENDFYELEYYIESEKKKLRT